MADQGGYSPPTKPGGPENWTTDTFRKLKPQSAVYGRALAILFGTQRASGSIIFSGLYHRTIAAYGAVASTVTQVALCEGTISDVLAVWKEKTKSTLAGFSMTLSTGTLPQSAWSYLTTNFPALALGYGGVALVSTQTAVGTLPDGSLERMWFEVKGLNATKQDGATTAYDADPAEVVQALLTSQIYGLAWPTSRLGDQSAGVPFQLGADGTTASGYARYCAANDWFISMAITEQRPTRDIIQEVLAATDSAALWSEGALKIRPLGEDTVTGSVTYTPYLTPQYDLGASSPGSDFIADPGDPAVTLERVKRADTYNCYPVEFSNRFPARKDTTGAAVAEPFNAYNAWTEDGVPDPVDVERVGLRKAGVTTLRCITREAHAKAISSLLTRRALYTTRNTYRFRLGWRFALLEPTDLVTLTDAALGLSRQLVRITEIEEQDDGTFDVTAQEVGTVATAGAAAYTVT